MISRRLRVEMNYVAELGTISLRWVRSRFVQRDRCSKAALYSNTRADELGKGGTNPSFLSRPSWDRGAVGMSVKPIGLSLLQSDGSGNMA